MAIEKVKTRKMEMTSQSMICFGVAIVLAVLSLILGLKSVGNFRLKANLNSGLFYFTTNRADNARQSLEAALGVDPTNVWARELLAKINADAGALDVAEADYKRLQEMKFTRATVKCGLGVIYLRRADRTVDDKEFQTFVKQARDHFNAAKGADPACPEAFIGLAHADLLESARRRDAGLFGKARDGFVQIESRLKTDPTFRGRATRDGLVDFYAGMGKVSASPDRYNPVAAQYFIGCRVYASRWALPLSNYLNIEAQRYATQDFAPKDLVDRKSEIMTEMSSLRGLWLGNRAVYGELKGPWLNLALAIPYAYAKAGDLNTFNNMMHGILLDDEFSRDIQPILLEASIKTQTFLRKDLSPEARKVESERLNQSLESLVLKPVVSEERNRAWKLVLLNNFGVISEYVGASQSIAAFVDRAERLLREALEWDKGNYVLNRNLAVILRKRGRTEDAKKYLEAAAKGAEAVGESADFEAVRKYVEP